MGAAISCRSAKMTPQCIVLAGGEKVQGLEGILRDRQSREDLVHQLLAKHAPLDMVLRLRFVSAVSDFERTTCKEDRSTKAQSIAEVFLKNGSRYQLSNISPTSYEDVRRRDPSHTFLPLKAEIVHDLCENSTVIEFLKAVEGTKFNARSVASQPGPVGNSKCVIA